MTQPTKQELKKFLELFDKLIKFEADQRKVRGYSCFTEQDLPFPEIIKVIAWLKELT